METPHVVRAEKEFIKMSVWLSFLWFLARKSKDMQIMQSDNVEMTHDL